MRKLILATTIATVMLTACNSEKKPTSANFTTAINRYLASHGRVCMLVGSQFPIDVPVSQENTQHGIGEKLAVLHRAGLLNATGTRAVVQSLASSISLSPHKAEQVKRYTVSTEGQKYLQTVMTDFGRVPAFCYGLKQVDSVVRWTEPTIVGSSTETQVTYRYKIVNLASWASSHDIEEEFPSIPNMLDGASKADQTIEVRSTNDGWSVPAP